MQETFSVSTGHEIMIEAMHLNQPNLISVLRPAFNLFTFLDSTINSVLAQTYPHFEHVIVDYFFTDRTEEIAAQYVFSEHQVQYIRFSDNEPLK